VTRRRPPARKIESSGNVEVFPVRECPSGQSSNWRTWIPDADDSSLTRAEFRVDATEERIPGSEAWEKGARGRYAERGRRGSASLSAQRGEDAGLSAAEQDHSLRIGSRAARVVYLITTEERSERIRLVRARDVREWSCSRRSSWHLPPLGGERGRTPPPSFATCLRPFSQASLPDALLVRVYANSARDDEFVEIGNPSPQLLDLTGWTLTTGKGPQHSA